MVLPVGEWQDVDINIALDSGCCAHVLDAEDVPGYRVVESPGSRRGQNFIVGNGNPVPNKGEVHLNMEADIDGGKTSLNSVFQVAAITRPLMSVSKICDQGLECLFSRTCAKVMNEDGSTVCEFAREGGLYVATMTLKAPNKDRSGHERPQPFVRQSR